MIGFALTPDQEALRSMAHHFAEEEIRPVAAAFDETEEVPWDVVRRAAEIGIPAYTLPERHGGGGFGDVFSRCLVDEELYWGCAGVATLLGGTVLAATPIMLAGTEDQQAQFLPRFCSTDEVCLGAFALTEPGAGSDPSAISTRARREGDSYVLDGAKCFVTNGGIAGVYVVFASTDSELGLDGLTAFIVDADTAGITAGKKERKMGIRASQTTMVHFDEVHVPAANRLGAEGEGFRIAMRTLDHTRSHVASGAVGIARAAFELATNYAVERRQFGRPISAFQGVSFPLADMATGIDAARLLAWRAAWLADAGQPCTMETAMAKSMAADVAMQVTTDAVQVLGGYGYCRDYPAEKWMRDAKIMQIFEGTAQVQRVIIARQLTAAVATRG